MSPESTTPLTPSTLSAARPASSPAELPQALDASCRSPLAFMFLAGAVWLVAGLTASLVCMLKLHTPGVLADSAWLAYGRLRPAAETALIYGFASQAALGAALWVLCRLGRVGLATGSWILIAQLFWNLGVLVGAVGILAGDGTGVQGLAMPGYAGPILLGSYLLVGLCALLTFAARRVSELYVSQWYILAALFTFPWIFTTAHLSLVTQPVRGITQVIISGWFTGNLRELWLTALCLALLFYFLPKLTGRPLHSRYLAMFGFWFLVLFGGWLDLATTGPAPRWVTAMSTAIGGLMIVPVLAVATNCLLTLQGYPRRQGRDPVLVFVLLGVVSYVAAGLWRAVNVLPPVQGLLGLTYFNQAVEALSYLGFMLSVISAAIYFILPRVLGQPWAAPRLIRWHLRIATIGLVFVVLGLAIAGLRQGFLSANPDVEFLAVAKATLLYLRLASFGLVLVTFGSVVMLVNLAWTCARQGRTAWSTFASWSVETKRVPAAATP